MNSLVPRSFSHSHIINPISKLTNFTLTWPLNDSEARSDLVLIQTALFFFWGGGGGVKDVFLMLTSEHLNEKRGIF